MTRASFVVFEGIDGSGKSTQAARLVEALQRVGAAVVRSHEPYDCEAGRAIRAMARSGERVAPEQELAWFWEQRREHVRDVIEPALAAGRHVVCDRYYLSTVAYQGARALEEGARGLDADVLLRRSEAEFPRPDLVLILEIAPAVGLARVSSRGEPHEPAFEEVGFLARVAKLFHEIDRDYLERIDASGSPAEIHQAVLARVSERLGLL